ncbi:DUF3574 domain-containing protein [Streptomyces sp. NPDC058274]|jgi:hypothetical protein|uniref:DUF3574 domain-containing protein n=1 Tax=Streptomyces sp. NPDC058274 TaxID=3346416 RepID=UPI0029D1B2F0|nr:hypothetical protein [Streptomyces sp.]
MITHSMRSRAGATVATVLVVAGAPVAYAGFGDGASRPEVRGTAYIETQLFFGTERPDGGPAVTDAQFMDFVDREVTPAFPDGLTVQDGRGQWRDASGRVEHERSYELILLYPQAAAGANDRKIEKVRHAYVKAFGQEAVARVDDRAEADF